MAPEDAAICPQHSFDPASTCRQCSAIYCARCLPGGFNPVLCLRCNTTLAVREAPDKIQRAFRDLWVLPLIMSLGIFLMFILVGISAAGRSSPVVSAAIPFAGCIFGTPLLLVALLSGLTRAIAVAWIGIVIELLLALSFLVDYVNLLSLVFAALAAIIPIRTMVQIFKIKELQDLQRAHQADQPPIPLAVPKQ